MQGGRPAPAFHRPHHGAVQGSRNVRSCEPSELSQFNDDVSVELRGEKVVLTTEEYDVSAFLKIMVNSGARVEVFSGHDYPMAEEADEG